MFKYVVLRIDRLEAPQRVTEHSQHESKQLAEEFRDQLNQNQISGPPYYVSCETTRWERVRPLVSHAG